MDNIDEALAQVVELARAGNTPQKIERGTAPYVVIPQNCKVEDLSRLIYNENAPNPVRKAGTITVHDATSFIEYYTLFCDEHSRVFADQVNSTVLAILDYHGAGENAPRWCKHRVKLTLKDSDEWKVWSGANGKKMSQPDFAEFMEENQPDITEPSAATMLEVSRSLQATTEASFEQSTRLSNGQIQLSYKESVNGTFGASRMSVPEAFKIAVPVYVGSAPVTVTARLRFRVSGGKLTLWYDLHRPEDHQRRAFADTLKAIESGLPQTKIINGAPAA